MGPNVKMPPPSRATVKIVIRASQPKNDHQTTSRAVWGKTSRKGLSHLSNTIVGLL